MLLENKSYPIYPGSSILHTSTSTSTSSNHLNKYCAVYCDSSITSAIFESQKNAPSFRITSEEQNPISPLVFDFPSGHHHGEASSISCETVNVNNDDYILTFDPKSETFTLDSLASSLFLLPPDRTQPVVMDLSSGPSTPLPLPEKNEPLYMKPNVSHSEKIPLQSHLCKEKEKEKEKEIDMEIELNKENPHMDLEEGCEIDELELIHTLDATTTTTSDEVLPSTYTYSPKEEATKMPSLLQTSITTPSLLPNLKKRPISLTEKLASHSSDESSSSDEEDEKD